MIKRPLYKLKDLLKHTDHPVYVVADMATADELLGEGKLATCIIGGPPYETDWEPLAGRRVSVWQSEVTADIEKILGAIKPAVDLIKIPSSTQTDEPETRNWLDELARTEKGVIRVTAANGAIIFLNDPEWKNVLAYDLRTMRISFTKKPPIQFALVGENLADVHVTTAGIWLQKKYNISLGSHAVWDALISAAHKNKIDPVRNWMEALPKWDKTERLDHWLSDCTGCEDTEYAQAVGAAFLISAVARTYQPGCKVDTMLILHGAQGSLKSTLLAVLAGEFFSDQIGEIGNKDTVLQIHGPLLIEMGELDSMSRRDITAVKSWLTSTVDRIRPPYGRAVIDLPRRCVIAGTTNSDEFLSDTTGGRRFWPVAIRQIEIDILKKMRDQLWAEARARYLAGANWWLDENQEIVARDEQEQRRTREPWEQIIRKYLAENESSVSVSPPSEYDPKTGLRRWTTTEEILTCAVKMPLDRQTRGVAILAGKILKLLGWRRQRQRIGEERIYVYLRPIPRDGAEVVEIETGERRDPMQAEIEFTTDDAGKIPY